MIFHLKTFLISLGVAFFMVYILDEPKKIVYIYPNKDNLEQNLYRTKDGNCFKAELINRKCEFRAKEVFAE